MKFSRIIWIVPILLFIFLRKKAKRKNRKAKVYEPQYLQKMLRVRRIWQRKKGINRPNSACGPATAAMLIQYLARQNKANLAGKSSAKIVNHLYNEMGTLPWGTSAKRWQKGFIRYVQAKFPNDKWAVHLGRAAGQFNVYCQSIDNNIPVVLRFIFNNNTHAFASHHYILGVGYSVKNNEQKIAVVDADGGEINSRIHWIDWHQNEQFIKMLRISRTNR